MLNMTRPEPETFFPELEGDEQRLADEWLREYLRLVVRIYREHIEAQADSLSTPSQLTSIEVLASSVQPDSGRTPKHKHDEVLRIHTSIDNEAG